MGKRVTKTKGRHASETKRDKPKAKTTEATIRHWNEFLEQLPWSENKKREQIIKYIAALKNG